MLNGDISRKKRGIRLRNLIALLALACLEIRCARPRLQHRQPELPKQDYLVYVVCESADKIVLLRFGPKGLQIESQSRTGLMPMDINGPHGIAVSPDKQYFYVSEGHGRPEGSVWKYRAGSDDVIKYTGLGMFPATTDITPDGNFIYVANANFHGDMVPSSISVVATDQMIEVKRITTCTMPHGSRLNHAGTRHYSACMMDDMLVEIDTSKFAVSRYFMLAPGKEMGMSGAPYPAGADQKMHNMADHKPVCTPTWAQPSNDGSTIYVACNQSNDIVAVNTADWKLARRFPAGNGVYNLAMTKDGRLIATNKRGQSVSIFDPISGKELASIPTKTKSRARCRCFARRPLRVHFGGRSRRGARDSRSDRPRQSKDRRYGRCRPAGGGY